jgi:hypothetical protein
MKHQQAHTGQQLKGKSLAAAMLLDFVNEYGNRFEL